MLDPSWEPPFDLQDRPLDGGAALRRRECRERVGRHRVVKRHLAGDDAPAQIGDGGERGDMVEREADAGMVAVARDDDPCRATRSASRSAVAGQSSG